MLLLYTSDKVEMNEFNTMVNVLIILLYNIQYSYISQTWFFINHNLLYIIKFELFLNQNFKIHILGIIILKLILKQMR